MTSNEAFIISSRRFCSNALGMEERHLRKTFPKFVNCLCFRIFECSLNLNFYELFNSNMYHIFYKRNFSKRYIKRLNLHGQKFKVSWNAFVSFIQWYISNIKNDQIKHLNWYQFLKIEKKNEFKNCYIVFSKEIFWIDYQNFILIEVFNFCFVFYKFCRAKKPCVALFSHSLTILNTCCRKNFWNILNFNTKKDIL